MKVLKIWSEMAPPVFSIYFILFKFNECIAQAVIVAFIEFLCWFGSYFVNIRSGTAGFWIPYPSKIQDYLPHQFGLTTRSSPSSVNIKLYIEMRCGIYLFLNNVFYTLCFEKYFMVTNDHLCNSLNCWCNKNCPIR